MILVTLEFTNVSNNATYDFLQSGCRVQKFSPSYQGRVVDRPRMQEHGAVPTVPYIDKLPIAQEGLLIGDSQFELIDERDRFLEAVLGNLSRRKTLAKSGVLTVEYEGWGEQAEIDVAVESAEAPLEKDGVRTCNYMVNWIAFDPYSGTSHYL
jgi:hypothetical protein